MRRTEMLKAREILRLKYQIGLSLRDIAKSCSCGKTTVSEVLERANKAKIGWPLDLNDKELISLLYPPVQNQSMVPEPDIEYIFYEMKKKHLTLMLLWEEYKEVHPDGIMYTQFCKRYREFKKQNKLTMHIEHKAGEEMQVDWAGSTLPYIDTITGEVRAAYIFVAPDNTKTAVITPDVTDPVLNRSYNDMANHYGTAIVPARIKKAKDKAADENMVGNISRRILASLRNTRFFSVSEINQAIPVELAKFIRRPFAKMEGNRLTAYEKIDKPALMALPKERYQYCDWKETRVAFNYHVEYDRFYYSVDYGYANHPCAVRATKDTIEVFVDNERVAAHTRNYNKARRYITMEEHMPGNHRAVSGWSSKRFILWANSIGPSTGLFIDNVLKSRKYPVQAYRACMAIMSFSKDCPAAVMENAAKKALDMEIYSFKYFKMIFKQMSSGEDKDKSSARTVAHDNLRGSNAYAGGGINA